MKDIIISLPNLTHNNITIQDRLSNIRHIDSAMINLSTTRGDLQFQNIIIECLRVIVMAIEYPGDITEDERSYIRKLLNNPKSLNRSYADLILDKYVYDVLPVEYIADIINYYNRIIPIGKLEENPSINNWPRIYRLITTDTLLINCEKYLRKYNKEFVVKMHMLIDEISNGTYHRNNTDIPYNNMRLITNGYCSRMTIKNRYKYTKQLGHYLMRCPIAEIDLLVDHIVVEKIRMMCMLLASQSIPLYIRDIHYSYLNVGSLSNFMMDIFDYFDEQYELPSDLYIEILDIMKYYNYLTDNKLIKQSSNHPHIDIKYLSKFWDGDSTKLVDYIKIQYRVDTINDLIS